MKKNAMLKIAAILMVAVLLTTCAISSTFAKYTTTGPQTTDTARVAKWGVTVETDISTLFADKYDDANGKEAKSIVVTVDDETGAITIADASNDNIVAPGTSGQYDFTNTVAGIPEVAVAISMTADLALTGWTLASGVYCPLVFNVDGNEYKMGTVLNEDTEDKKTITTLADLEEAVEAAIVAASAASYPAGTNLATVEETNFLVTWEWAFDNTENSYIDDAKDTALTELGTCGVSLTVQQTIEQINTFA